MHETLRVAVVQRLAMVQIPSDPQSDYHVAAVLLIKLPRLSQEHDDDR